MRFHCCIKTNEHSKVFPPSQKRQTLAIYLSFFFFCDGGSMNLLSSRYQQKGINI